MHYKDNAIRMESPSDAESEFGPYQVANEIYTPNDLAFGKMDDSLELEGEPEPEKTYPQKGS